jgi:translation initiation factor 1 (eIF-1/SUI1)
MRQKFYESDLQINILSYTMKRKKDCIIQLKKEKKRAIEKLKRDLKKFKSEFMNFMPKSDDINIETTTIKKRKREFICLIE